MGVPRTDQQPQVPVLQGLPQDRLLPRPRQRCVPRRAGHHGETVSFVYGGIAFPSAEFYHAEEAEASSVGIDLTDSETLQKLLKMIDDSVNADDDQHEGSADFRKGLASSLLYKFLL